MRVDNSARSGGIIRISLIFYDRKVCCVFSLESPHRGDSNEYKQSTVFNIKKKITLNFPILQPRDYFLGTQERVRNKCGKRAIGVRAIEVLLYMDKTVLSDGPYNSGRGTLKLSDFLINKNF